MHIGAAARSLTSFQLCSVNSSSSCITPFQLWPPLLSSDYRGSSQFFSQLFSTALKFFRLFPPQLNSFHLFPPLLNSSQRLSPLPTSSHLFSTLLLLQRSLHTDKLLHRASFYTEKLLRGEALTLAKHDKITRSGNRNCSSKTGF